MPFLITAPFFSSSLAIMHNVLIPRNKKEVRALQDAIRPDEFDSALPQISPWIPNMLMK
jgi:hypothetical protein